MCEEKKKTFKYDWYMFVNVPVSFRCEEDSCIFDHSEYSSNEQHAEESQYQGILYCPLIP